MNITPHTTSLPLATVVNQPTDGLRRENNQREIITKVIGTNPSAADKGVASDKERARTPAQSNEQLDFTSLRKQAEHAASVITEQDNHQNEQQSGQQEQNTEKGQEEQDNPKVNAVQNGQSDQNSEQVQVDEKIISQLQQRDKEVKAHELAHASTGGATTGSPSYTFEIGPDGKKYAVGGEVAVDLSSVAGDPQATIVKMQKVYAAALAPANPSTQDTRVAASAAQKILAAQSELLALKNEKLSQAHSANASSSPESKASSNFYTNNSRNSSDEFDALINRTFYAQDAIAPSSSTEQLNSLAVNTVQSSEVLQRANRIENFYFNISQGYEKPDNFQFEITA